jgi:hypothetical protein
VKVDVVPLVEVGVPCIWGEALLDF